MVHGDYEKVFTVNFSAFHVTVATHVAFVACLVAVVVKMGVALFMNAALNVLHACTGLFMYKLMSSDVPRANVLMALTVLLFVVSSMRDTLFSIDVRDVAPPPPNGTS